MPCVPGQRNGGRAQHRLQYLSAFGPDRRFALASRLGAAVRAGKPGRGYVENARDGRARQVSVDIAHTEEPSGLASNASVRRSPAPATRFQEAIRGQRPRCPALQ